MTDSNASAPLYLALIYTVIMAAIIFFTRAFSFLLFSHRKPPRILQFVEKYIPPMILTILVFYCFKDVGWTSRPWGIPHCAAAAITAALHLWKKNAMLSIFCGTIVFMVLRRVMT